MKLRYVAFYGRLIPVVEIPDRNDLGIIMDDVAIQLGLMDHLDQVVDQALYDLKLLVHIVTIETEDGPIERMVIPLERVNLWLSKIPQNLISKDAWFTQEVIDPDTGEVQEEVANQQETFDIYLSSLVAVLYSSWDNGAPRHAKYAMGSLWRTGKMNLQSILGRFCEYSETRGCDYTYDQLMTGIRDLLMTLLPEEVVRLPESAEGIDLYRLALAEDFIARTLNEAILNEEDPYMVLSRLDSDLIVVFHKTAEQLLKSIGSWAEGS